MSFQPGQLGTTVGLAIWKSLAYVAQYVIPVGCLFAAVMSAVGRRQRQGLVSQVAQSKAPDALDGMTWREFELLVGEAFRQGYQVAEVGGGGADGGVDLVLRKDREKFIVQCKQWRAFKVGVQVVRELYGVMAAAGAAGGFVVTSGRFTDEATAFANGRNVKLIDGPKLFGLIQQAKASLANKGTAPAPVQRARRCAPKGGRCTGRGAALSRVLARHGVSGEVNPLLFGGEGAVFDAAEYELGFDVTKRRWPRKGPSVRWVTPLRGQNGKSGSNSGGARSGTS